MNQNLLTVILPCAGKGTRLSLPFSKEIMPVGASKCLIDFAFQNFSNCNRDELEFVITITKDKIDLISYLKKYTFKFNIKFIYFNDDYSEFPGSIRSAEPLLGHQNLILLPDTYISFAYDSFYEKIMNSFKSQSQFFVVKKSTDYNFLSSKGCLVLDSENCINHYEDKPICLSNFNAVWSGICFSKTKFESTLSVIESATFKQDDANEIFIKSKFYKSIPVIVDEFIDLGTWNDLSKFIFDFNMK
jgi:NDP-sugar pyrophosphorylase family protein